MTLDELRDDICSRLNLTSQEAKTRVVNGINRAYRTVASSIGIDAARFTSVTQTTTNGVATVEFTGLEKIDRVFDATDATAIRLLTQVTVHQVRSMQPGTSEPVCFAIQGTEANAVTIRLDTLPQTTYSLVADGWSTLGELTGNDAPAIPASFHDILIQYVLAEEYERKEKTDLADRCLAKAEHRLSELRFHLADNDIDWRQGSSTVSSGATGSSSGGGNSGASSYTQTGLITFDRGALAPFALVSGAAVITYLDADKLDGQHGSYYLDATNLTTGTLPNARISSLVNANIDAAAAIAWTKISKTGSSLADLTTKSAADLSSGTLPDARFPSTLPALNGSLLTALNATNLASGTVPDARFPSTLPALNGSALTALGPANVAAGTFAVILSNSAQPRAVAYHNTTQSISDITFTVLSLNSEDVDVASMHSNTSRVTIPTGGTGFYLVVARVNFASNNTGQRAVEIYKNGTTGLGVTQLRTNDISDHTQQASWMGVLTAADYVEIRAYQSSGGALNVGSATREYSNELSVVKLY